MVVDVTPEHRPPPGGEYYVFRDAIHNLIEIEDADEGIFIRDLLKTVELQRLRHIRQNGFSFLVYPSLETSRFPHVLGAFHIARRLSASLADRRPTEAEGFPATLRLTSRDCLAFSVAALLHDLGHGPLSHVWEECWAQPRKKRHFHEHMGKQILLNEQTAIRQFLVKPTHKDKFARLDVDVIAFLTGQHRLSYLIPLLAGNLDVDRLDFMSRDTRTAGVTYGFHDLEWIIRSLRFARLPAQYTEGKGARWIIAIDGRKGLGTLVQFLHARENMYSLVYQHKTTRAASKMLQLVFRRVKALSRRKTKGGSPILIDAIKSDDISVTDYLALDDSDIWVSLKYWAQSAHDKILKKLSAGLLSRDLFKAYVLSERVYKRLRELDKPSMGNILARKVAARVGCDVKDSQYYYCFDEASFDIVGRKPALALQDVWIMQSSALGFSYQTLRQYWEKEIQEPTSRTQYLLLVHRDVVDDLSVLIERLSFIGSSAETLKLPSHPPPPYRVLAPLGAAGAWKQVYVGVHTQPGDSPESIVALKRYINAEQGKEATKRDVADPNLLGERHRNLSHAELLTREGGETWIREGLWTASLDDLVKRHGARRDIIEIVRIASDLFGGLAALHKYKLRHTDIKPDNCGIVRDVQGDPVYQLGDFGCLSSRPTEMPTGWQLLGTLRTRAPEVIKRERISLASDVWAMGATIYALCTLEFPFIPFEAPHEDGDERDRREQEIKEHLDDRLEAFLARAQDNLPPHLFDRLLPAFGLHDTRDSAERLFTRFEKARIELTDSDSSGPIKTAWQRAEDVLSTLQENGASALDTEMSKEIDAFKGAYRPYIPPAVLSAIETVLGP